jgi:hypothetical protein
VSAEPVQEDGDLVGALRRLGDAISALTDPRAEVADGKTHWLDSYYIELRDALPGDQGSGHGVARSLPALWLDALDLLTEIDTAVRCWEPTDPGFDGDLTEEPTPPTILRLRVIERHGCRGRSWRPQDTSKVEQIAGNIESWVASIKSLLTPVPAWTLPSPCPSCNTATVYRKDAAGELIRRPALQIGPQGCVCAKCHATWAPEYFTHLARVLGYELPEGVLE